jgi:heterodisulfide reductase subunit C2
MNRDEELSPEHPGIDAGVDGRGHAKAEGVVSHDPEALGDELLRKIEALSGVSVRHCFQCGKCSAGCPMASFMDILPTRIMRMLQMGQADKVLEGLSIWRCASCETCSSRCPNEVDLASVMDVLRKLSVDSKGPSKERFVQLANKLFLQNIRRYGRQYEMRLAAEFNLKSGQFFKDFELGPEMMSKGKLKLLHRKNRNIEEIEKIFRRIEEMRGKGEIL